MIKLGETSKTRCAMVLSVSVCNSCSPHTRSKRCDHKVWHVVSSENGKKSNGRDIRRRLSQGEPATCRVGRKRRGDTLKCHQAVVVDEENFAVFGGGDTRTLSTSTQPRGPGQSIYLI
jgi:hypothetical protein